MLDKIIAVEYYWLQGNSDSQAVLKCNVGGTDNWWLNLYVKSPEKVIFLRSVGVLVFYLLGDNQIIIETYIKVYPYQLSWL